MAGERILIGKGTEHVYLRAEYGNRHGLVAGATGTGKTVSLLVLAEGFSRIGVPVFIADVKGDVAGISLPGAGDARIQERVKAIGIADYRPEASPTVPWDVFGEAGHPLRTTVSEIGPLLLSRMLDLNETQAGVIDVAFKLADDRRLLLLDLDDLRAVLGFAAEHRKEVSAAYGLVSSASVAAIQRSLLALERDGGDAFFGEPALDLADVLRVDSSGRGVVGVLAAERLVRNPRLYSGVLLWLVSELFEDLPEVGDLDRPKLALFLDEAHLLFDGATPALRRQVEQVVRLVRSKGVGVYFCSQFPDDVPDEILGQLGNRVQHALRAFTPRDQKAVRVAAETFVPNPTLDVARVLTELGVGEALVSTLAEKGRPTPVERTIVAPPRCRIGTIGKDERAALVARSPVGAKYDQPLNRESAYEMLSGRRSDGGAASGDARKDARTRASAPPPEPSTERPARRGDGAKAEPAERGALDELLWGTKRRQGMVETMAKQAARSVGSQIGRQILRGVLGGIFGGRSRR
ncbi:MAG TPA: helicase HerA-like domain-containing protein [Candidatus Binatia bacterium]|nr:helicase HerA-like domain-containing protein [Candidatus Binatia bacterium]